MVLAAIAVGIGACSRPADQSAAAKPELTPTAPAIGAPPANPPPVMPPPAATVMAPSGSDTAAVTPPEKAKPADSGSAKPDSAQTAQGGDPSAKQPMSKDEESTAMPKPGQANDHSTTATDGKQ